MRPFIWQLPLEGAIASIGGFDSLSPSKPERLQLIGLNSRKTAEISTEPESVAQTWQRLSELISAYQTPEVGYTARLRPERLTYESEFDHLSRKGEWSDGDDPQDKEP